MSTRTNGFVAAVMLLCGIVIVAAVVWTHGSLDDVGQMDAGVLRSVANGERVALDLSPGKTAAKTVADRAIVATKHYSNDELTAMACRTATGEWRCASKVPAMKFGAIGGVRPPILPASWAVPNWYIDPSNISGAASDANNCTSRATPCVTWAEIVARWGTNAPHISAATVITFMSSQTAPWTDPVVWMPYQDAYGFPNAGQANLAAIVGDLTSAQQVAAGTFTSVIPRNAWTNQRPTINFNATSGSIAAADIVNDTSVGHPNSFSWLYTLVSGTTWVMTGLETVDSNGGACNSQDFWQTGDSFVAYKLVHVNIEKFAPLPNTTTQATDPVPTNSAQLYGVYIVDPLGTSWTNRWGGPGYTVFYAGQPLILQLVFSQRLVDMQYTTYSPGASSMVLENDVVPIASTQGCTTIGGYAYSLPAGGTLPHRPNGPEVNSGILTIFGAGCFGVLGGEVILTTGISVDQNVGSSQFRGVDIENNEEIHVWTMGNNADDSHTPSLCPNAFPDAGSDAGIYLSVYGQGFLDMAGQSRYRFGQVASSSFGPSLHVTLNAYSVGDSINDSTGVITTNISITPANLETAGDRGLFRTNGGASIGKGINHY